MTELIGKLYPTAINLHQKSRLLEISFSDGFSFNYPCEYLRVYSPAAEVKIATQPVHGKAGVNITHIEPQGNYAIRLFFDDGHNTGVYSWETLHRLGIEYEHNWRAYLARLEQQGLSRGEVAVPGERSITLLYFMQLAKTAGQSEEHVLLPDSVHTVADLLMWLGKRGTEWHSDFATERVQVTVNKQFSEPTTPVKQGDEVAIVPRPRN